MGFPVEALVFCASQAPCRYETPEAGEGGESALDKVLHYLTRSPSLTTAPATPLRIPNVESKLLNVYNSCRERRVDGI